MQGIDFNTSLIFDKLNAWADGFVQLLPNIIVAIVVFIVFYLIAWFVQRSVRRIAGNHGRHSLGEVAGSLLKWIVIILGVMLAVTIIAPSIKPGDLLSGLGVSSVAIGFAFKDILQNMLAGILLLLKQPFEVGDQIISGNFEGTVEKIETRATLIKTYDGRLVVIPNSDIYTNSVVVNTAYAQSRSQYDVGIGCNDDWEKARTLMVEACQEVEGVLADPKPETIPVELGDFSNIIRLRWWTKSDRSTQIHVKGEVLQAVYQKLDAAGIDFPYPTQVHLWHDQTDEHDGDRALQREGWPSREDGNNPRPVRRRQEQSEAKKEEA